MYSFSDFNKLIGFEDVWEFERRYAERDESRRRPIARQVVFLSMM
jgi:hypothetical protein